jgi:hypothetical protein
MNTEGPYGVVTDSGYDSSVRWFENLEDAIDVYEDLSAYNPKVYIVQKLKVKTVYTDNDGSIAETFQQ